MILTLPTDKLTPRTADEFLVEFLDYAHGAVPGQPLEVDLRPLHFIDPYGLVALCLLARYGDALSSRVVFHLPHAFALRTYLGRVRFAAAVDGVELVGPALIVDQEREKEESEALLEITRIEERADIETVLGKIGQRVEAILAEELRYLAGAIMNGDFSPTDQAGEVQRLLNAEVLEYRTQVNELFEGEIADFNRRLLASNLSPLISDG